MKTTITGRLCACVVLTSALTVPAWANSPPTVTNITAAQRTDGSKLVDIGYDLADADGDPCTVSVLVSDDGGTTWNVPAVSLTGDIGAAITPGGAIVWDTAASLQYKRCILSSSAQSAKSADRTVGPQISQIGPFGTVESNR